jgi:hypothetical protein
MYHRKKVKMEGISKKKIACFDQLPFFKTPPKIIRTICQVTCFPNRLHNPNIVLTLLKIVERNFPSTFGGHLMYP